MPGVKLKFDGREFFLGSGVVTVGRTSDNSISFPDDPNISRYHAEIEERGSEYCITDLNSSNGTEVNGSPVSGEVYLSDGDVILLGGSAEIRVEYDKGEADPLAAHAATHPVAAKTSQNTESKTAAPGTAQAAAAGSSANAAGSGKMLLLAGGIFGLALIFAVGVGVFYMMGDSSCGASAVIRSPERGDTISKPTEIDIDVADGACAVRAIFALDGIEFAESTDFPFTASIDPADFPDLADGFDHPLTIILEDEDGNRLPQSQPVLLAFETRAIKKPDADEPGKPGPGGGDPQRPDSPKTATASLIEVNDMAKNMLKQFGGGDKLIVSNRQFLQEVQRMTAEYAKPGYFARASVYRDAINVGFVREQNLDAGLGYVLAMSRTQFDANGRGQEQGLWRMTEEFASTNQYNGMCGPEKLNDPSQNCAAKATALYMKTLVFSVFDGDVVYAAAAFGKSSADAATWKASLPPNRSDLWNSIKTAPEREQLVRFIAAGIVAENPAKFGLAGEKPLSELYRLAL